MATKKNAEAVPEAKETVAAVQYTADEFAEAAGSVFGTGTSPDTVRAAFRVNGVKKATVEEAKKLVNAFAKKEVER